jgi:hypothetical protein
VVSNEDALTAIALASVIFVAGFILGGMAVNSHYMSATVKRGFAEYDRQTGAWQWVETETKGGEE